MGKKITINCEGSGLLDLADMKPFQGSLKGLKEPNYVKLKGLIQSMGFSFPIFVWQDGENSANYIIDGHQRVKTLNRMQKEGFEIPPLPVAFVTAGSFKDAKKKLMAAASQFGDIDKHGLYDFINENDIEFEFLEENYKLPEINFDDFKNEFIEDDFSFKDPGDPEPKEDIDQIIVDFEDAQAMETLFRELIDRGFNAKVKR